MHAQKITKAFGTPAVALPTIDRREEEERLLQRWAASDSERSIDDFDSDDSSDRKFDMDAAGLRSGYDRFDA